MTDAMVLRAQSGDSEAFAELYREHRPKVLAICARMLRDPQCAEDMSQDIFIVLLRKIGKFRHEAKFSTWLHRVAVNHVLMSQRSKVPVFVDEEVIYTLAQEPVDVPTRMDLEHALDRLSYLDRAVILQHFIEGYSYDESARNLGAATPAIKTRAFRSRAKLQKYMTAGVGK